MKYQVYWRQVAAEQLMEMAARNARQARRIAVVVRTMQIGEFGDIKKLAGSHEWRVRVGDWRLLWF